MTRSVSVLMPVLNEERSVLDAVGSALSQTGCDLQVLVVDGRSADQTRELVSELAERDGRVVLLDNPTVIIPAGLNVALAASRTDYVARIDGHTSVSEGYLARAVDQLVRDPSLGGIGGRRRGVARTRMGRSVAAVMSSRFGVGNSINHYATDTRSPITRLRGLSRRRGPRDGRLGREPAGERGRRLRSPPSRAGYRIAYDPEMVVDWHGAGEVDAVPSVSPLRPWQGGMVRKNGRDGRPPPASGATDAGRRLTSYCPSGSPLARVLAFLAACTARRRPGSACHVVGAWIPRNSLPAMPDGFRRHALRLGPRLPRRAAARRSPAVASGSTRTSTSRTSPPDRVASSPSGPSGRAARPLAHTPGRPVDRWRDCSPRVYAEGPLVGRHAREVPWPPGPGCRLVPRRTCTCRPSGDWSRGRGVTRDVSLVKPGPGHLLAGLHSARGSPCQSGARGTAWLRRVVQWLLGNHAPGRTQSEESAHRATAGTRVIATQVAGEGGAAQPQHLRGRALRSCRRRAGRRRPLAAGRPARRPCLPPEGHVLGVDEESLVESAQLAERRASDRHAGSGGPPEFDVLAEFGSANRPASGRTLCRPRAFAPTDDGGSQPPTPISTSPPAPVTVAAWETARSSAASPAPGRAGDRLSAESPGSRRLTYGLSLPKAPTFAARAKPCPPPET